MTIKKLWAACTTLVLAAGFAVGTALPASATGSDGAVPYTVDESGITLPSGDVFPDGGHVNIDADAAHTDIHFEALNQSDDSPKKLYIGASFIPWSAFGLSAPFCVSWVQISLYDEHFGEGGQAAVCVEGDTQTPPDDTDPVDPVDPDPVDPVEECVEPADAHITHAYDGTSGSVTAPDLCAPLYVGVATWSVKGLGYAWPQQLESYEIVTVDDGTFELVHGPGDCRQRDLYASWNHDDLAKLKVGDTLHSPGRPYEPPFLHEFSEGPAPTWWLDDVEHCNVLTEIEFVPEPVVTDECGLDNEVVEYDSTEQYTFSHTKADSVVTVTAEAADGHVFANGETELSWSFPVNDHECELPTHPLDVPSVTTHDETCESAGSFTLSSESGGVLWTVDGETVAEGVHEVEGAGTVTIVAEPAEGFGFAFDQQTEWTLEFEGVKDCESPEPTEPGVPTVPSQPTAQLPTLPYTGAGDTSGWAALAALLLLLGGGVVTGGAVLARSRA